MSTYPRLQGYINVLQIRYRKHGKQLQEKRKKMKLRQRQKKKGKKIDTSGFLGIDYENSVYIPKPPLGIDQLNASEFNDNVIHRVTSTPIRH